MSPRAWSVILSAELIVWATSYASRGFTQASPLEAFLTADQWAWLIGTGSGLLLIGAASGHMKAGMSGHGIGLFSHLTFAVSSGVAAVQYEQGWVGVGMHGVLAVIFGIGLSDLIKKAAADDH